MTLIDDDDDDDDDDILVRGNEECFAKDKKLAKLCNANRNQSSVRQLHTTSELLFSVVPSRRVYERRDRSTPSFASEQRRQSDLLSYSYACLIVASFSLP